MEIKAIDGKNCEAAFIRSGRDPGHLARFLKKYPAGHYLSWVKAELAKWWAGGDFDNLKLLQPGRGQRKQDAGLMQVYTDFLIYKAVTELIKEGRSLTKTEGGIFYSLQKQTFAESSFSWQHIRDRYYRFLHFEPVVFIDEGKKMIFGPVRIEFCGINFIGFGEYKPEGGFNLITPL